MITPSSGSTPIWRWLVSHVATWCLVACFANVTLAAHQFHATTAELEWNGESGWFEVSLKLPGLVIEDELSRLQQRRINLETTPDGEQLLQDYVRSRFQLTAGNHESCEFQWIGMEVDVRHVWVYFEIRPGQPAVATPDPASDPASNATQPPPISSIRTTNTTAADVKSLPFQDLKVTCRLLETRTDQVNLVNARCSNHRAALHLTAEQPEGVLDFTTNPAALLPRGWSIERTENPPSVQPNELQR